MWDIRGRKKLNPSLRPSPHIESGLQLGTNVRHHASLVRLPNLQEIMVEILRVRLIRYTGIVCFASAHIACTHHASPECIRAAVRWSSGMSSHHGRSIYSPHDHVHWSHVGCIRQLHRLPFPAYFEWVHVRKAWRPQTHRLTLSNACLPTCTDHPLSKATATLLAWALTCRSQKT